MLYPFLALHLMVGDTEPAKAELGIPIRFRPNSSRSKVGVEALDFTAHSPKSSVGNLEIWIAGRGALSPAISMQTLSNLGRVGPVFSPLFRAIRPVILVEARKGYPASS